jgi:hypothetical protein
MREYLLAYQFPHYMPGAVPLGLDGGGIFAVFDTRAGLRDGEYPILASGAGDLCWDDAVPLAASFAQFCEETVRIAEVLSPPSGNADFVDIVIVRPPVGGLRSLSAAMHELNLVVPARELRSFLAGLPKVLCANIRRARADAIVERLNRTDPFLAVVPSQTADR